MLIDLHAHQLTRAMFNQDDHWGPFWEGTLRVGPWTLGHKGGPATPTTLDQIMTDRHRYSSFANSAGTQYCDKARGSQPS